MSKPPSLAKELATLRAAATDLYKAGPEANKGIWEALRAALQIPAGYPPGGVSAASGRARRE